MAEEKNDKNIDEFKRPEKGSGFFWGLIPFDPLFIWIALIYGVTRIVEWILQTEGFWERTWIKIVDWADVDEHDFMVWVTSLTTISLYWVMSFIFLVLDRTGMCKKYKVQPGKNEPVEMSKVLSTLFTVFFNQLVVSITFSSGAYWMGTVMIGERMLRQVPTFWILMRDLFAGFLIFDVSFYIMHRTLHSKRFYKRIHKIHHEFKAPIGIASIYAHPTEHLITNMGSTIVAPIILASDVSTLWVWLACVTITTITDHSGYHFPFLKSPEFHDHHHVFFTECYGTSGVMDFIFRTDVKFRQSIQFKRHRILMSLKSSARELYPKRDATPKETVLVQ